MHKLIKQKRNELRYLIFSAYSYKGVTDAIWIKLNWIAFLMVAEYEGLNADVSTKFISAIRPTQFLNCVSHFLGRYFTCFLPALTYVCADWHAKIKGIIMALFFFFF